MYALLQFKNIPVKVAPQDFVCKVVIKLFPLERDKNELINLSIRNSSRKYSWTYSMIFAIQRHHK